MEILFVIAVAVIAILNILAFKYFHQGFILLSKRIIRQQLEIEKYIEENRNTVVEVITREHKATRKETQEMKTRLTQVRKDLNTIEKSKSPRK